MKLLFDQNLSPQLPRLLLDMYPGSVHVREVGLKDAADAAIWDYAREHGFVIASKDSDSSSAACCSAHRRSSSGCVWAIVPWRKARICSGLIQW